MTTNTAALVTELEKAARHAPSPGHEVLLDAAAIIQGQRVDGETLDSILARIQTRIDRSYGPTHDLYRRAADAITQMSYSVRADAGSKSRIR